MSLDRPQSTADAMDLTGAIAHLVPPEERLTKSWMQGMNRVLLLRRRSSQGGARLAVADYVSDSHKPIGVAMYEVVKATTGRRGLEQAPKRAALAVAFVRDERAVRNFIKAFDMVWDNPTIANALPGPNELSSSRNHASVAYYGKRNEMTSKAGQDGYDTSVRLLSCMRDFILSKPTDPDIVKPDRETEKVLLDFFNVGPKGSV